MAASECEARVAELSSKIDGFNAAILEALQQHSSVINRRLDSVEAALDRLQCRSAASPDEPDKEVAKEASPTLVLRLPEQLPIRKVTSKAGARLPQAGGDVMGTMESDSKQLDALRLKGTQGVEVTDAPALLGLGHKPELSAFAAAVDAASSRLSILVESRAFEVFWISVVLANAVVLGAQVEINAVDPQTDVPLVFIVLTAVFAALFMVEISLRFMACSTLRRFFWETPDYLWNGFDTLIVLLTVFHAVVEIAAFGFDVEDWHQLARSRIVRMVRTLRLLRAVRILKVVRHIGPLRALVRSTMNILQHIGWAVVLIMLVVYIMAMIYTDAATTYVAEILKPQGLSVQDVHPSLSYFCTGLVMSCHTMWWTITGGINYAEATNALLQIEAGWFWVLMFDVYVAFMMLGLLNVMTGIVCEKAIEFTEREKEWELANSSLSRVEAAEALKRLQIEMSGLEANSPAAFDRLMEDPWFSRFIASIECHKNEVGKGLFNQLFDPNGAREVNLDEFVEACLKLKWPAKALDMAAVRVDMIKIQKSLEELQRTLPPSP